MIRGRSSAFSGLQKEQLPADDAPVGRLFEAKVPLCDGTHFVERLPKKEYIRVDNRRVKHPLIAQPVEYFKEDENYFYVWTPKFLPEVLGRRAARDLERGTPLAWDALGG